MYEYRAKVLAVHDGDTCDVNVDLGFDIHAEMKIRLLGINAPELSKVDNAGDIARDALKALILDQTVTIKTVKDHKEKYGRMLATITTDAGINVNQYMLDNHFAVIMVR